MDSFELNKIAGAVLAALLVGFGLSILSEMIFETEAPEEPGYVIAVAEQAEGGGAEAEEAVPIAVLLASADVAAGEASFKKCAACHTVEQGGANKVGPNLWDIIGRPIASHEGYDYSDALVAYSNGQQEVWGYENLDAFIHDPKGTVPGTKMGFAGLKQDPERANVIAYLRSLSDNPEPLPDAPAETAAPAEGAPAEGAAAETTGEAQAQAGAAETPAQTQAPEAASTATGQPQPAPAAGAQPAVAPADEPAPSASPVPAQPEATPPAAAPPAATPSDQSAAPQAPPTAQSAETAPAAAPSAAPSEAAPAQAAAGSPIDQAVASADIAAGEAAAKKCVACHSFDEGGPNKVGPNLYGIVGRAIASHEGYNYSDALQEFSQGGSKVWDIATLDPYLQDPRGAVPGTKMAFAGLKRDEERHAMLAYLQSLSAAAAPQQ